MFDYLIFDFDGTVSDTYPVFTKALIRLLAENGIDADYETAYKQLKVSVGYALDQYDINEDARRGYMKIFKEIAREEQKAFPEAAQILEFSKRAGKRNYIYTHTGKFVYELLDKMELTGYFDFVLDGSYDFPRKPAPDALNFIIEKCGIDRSRAIMIGDRPIDTDAAANAVIAGCLIDVGGYFPDYKTDYHINSLLELKDII